MVTSEEQTREKSVEQESTNYISLSTGIEQRRVDPREQPRTRASAEVQAKDNLTEQARIKHTSQKKVNGTEIVGQKVPVIISNRHSANGQFRHTCTLSRDNVSSTNGNQRIPVVTHTAREIAKNKDFTHW